MSLKIQIMVHHNLRGRPLRTRKDLWAEKGKGKDNIIFLRWTVHLLKTQVAPHPMSMNLTHTWTPIPHNWSEKCNGSMSIRIQSSITCWCNNNKQLPHRRGKRGKSTMPNCWLHMGYHSCLPLSNIWHTTLG
jgi:hypothetical protein